MTSDDILGARRRITRQLDEARSGRLDAVPTEARRAALVAVLGEAVRIADAAIAMQARQDEPDLEDWWDGIDAPPLRRTTHWSR